MWKPQRARSLKNSRWLGTASAVIGPRPDVAVAPAPAPVFADEMGVYASDDDVDDGDLYKPTRLEVLELQHDQRRAAAAEIRGAYGF